MPRHRPRLPLREVLLRRCAGPVAAVAAGVVVLTGVAPAAAAQPAAASASGPLGFHDVLPNGDPRPIRNDLTGQLGGMVEFAQSHTIDPSGNTAKDQPTLVAERIALLLYTPTSAVTGVKAIVSTPGAPDVTLTMARPEAIPRDDQSDPYGRPDVVYSNRAWSVEVPWDRVKPGMSLRFVDGDRSGTLAAADIQVDAPRELIINGLELGMLTDAPTAEGHKMLSKPAETAADYFQTIPIAKLTVANYEPVTLDKVIVRSGAIYEVPGNSPGQGDVHNGDMREDVGKAQVSTGINLANFGQSSSPMVQSQPGIFNQRVYHHSAGVYANGYQLHGLSGGNGMLTLYDTVGNEFSHEMGHSFGLGHWPGRDTNAQGDERLINAVHHSESGWGYIAHRDRMRSNLATDAFDPAGRDVDGERFMQSFQDTYRYNRDAMSGGWVDSAVSEYTHHTAWSATRIQQNLTTRTPDTSFPSGYRAWQNGAWVDAKTADPSFDAPRPAKVGVPVTTLLGGYNPGNPDQSVLYPAFRSNYGNVFEFTEPDSTGRQCWAEASYLGGRVDRIPLDSSDGVKQLNINLESAAQPSGARVLCEENGVETELGSIGIRTDLPAMAAPVTIGQDAGYTALHQAELAQLEAALLQVADQERPILSETDRPLLDARKGDLSGLSEQARATAERALRTIADARDIDIFVSTNREALLAEDPIVLAQLHRLLGTAGFVEADGSLLPTGSAVSVQYGGCLDIDADGEVVVDNTDLACAGADIDHWFVDARGGIHPVGAPEMCLVAHTPVSVQPCDQRGLYHAWDVEDTGHVGSQAHADRYLNYYVAQGYPALWSRSDGTNALWRGLEQTANPAPALLLPATLEVINAVKDVEVTDIPVDPPIVDTPVIAPAVAVIALLAAGAALGGGAAIRRLRR